MTNSNIEIKGGEVLEIALNGSSSFIIQNLSDSDVWFKLKDSPPEVTGGIIEPKKPVKLAADTLVWTNGKANALLYILRS